MPDLLSVVAACLRCSGFRRLLVAFSGGMDSCALAQVLHELAPAEGLCVELAYFNHALRGQESEEEERFCRAFAAERDLPLHTGRWGEPRRSEQAARQARYRWLLETARAARMEAVLTAHHRRDQAETLLLRLVRGTGPRGLRAMAQRSELGAGIALLRPLLEVPREELHRHAQSRSLAGFEDSSNRSEEFLRNRIRHSLLPLLEELRPGAERRLARLAGQLREDCRGFDVLLEERLRGDLASGPGWAVLARGILRGEPGIARRAAIEAIRALGVPEPGLTPGALAALLRSARGGETRQRGFELGSGVRGLLLGDALAVLRGAPWLPRAPRLEEGQEAGHPDIERLLDVEILEGPLDRAEPRGPGSALRIRTRRPGDRLEPGGRPLKELFIGRRLARFLRERWPLVEDSSGLLLVPGLWQRPGAGAPRLRFGPSWPRPLLPPELNH